MSKPIAILCSDIHLSHKAPIARSAEPDWYDAMKRPLKELHGLKGHYNVPVVIAGDIFDKWNSPAELINFAYDYLPHCYAVPGQHDLPGHNINSIKRSAYWTLVRGGVIEHLPEQVHIRERNLSMTGFAWGQKLVQRYVESVAPKEVRLAVIHKYIWHKNASYVGASEADEASTCLRALGGYYDAFVIGDNHKRFKVGKNILNCGGFMRRKMDEVGYRPSVGILHDDSSIKLHYLDCSEDMFIDDSTKKELGEHALNLLTFIDNLQTLGNGGVDFIQTVKDVMAQNKVGKRVASAIIDALENKGTQQS